MHKGIYICTYIHYGKLSKYIKSVNKNKKCEIHLKNTKDWTNQIPNRIDPRKQNVRQMCP